MDLQKWVTDIKETFRAELEDFKVKVEGVSSDIQALQSISVVQNDRLAQLEHTQKDLAL